MLDKTDELEKPSFVAERSAFGKQCGERIWAWIFCGICQSFQGNYMFLWVKMLCTLNLTKRHHDGEVLDISSWDPGMEIPYGWKIVSWGAWTSLDELCYTDFSWGTTDPKKKIYLCLFVFACTLFCYMMLHVFSGCKVTILRLSIIYL